MRYTKHDNAFVWVEDIARAQRFADRFANLKWSLILNRYAKQVIPQLHDSLRGCQHYRVSAQSEYSTDILLKTRQDLCELYPKLLGHSTLCFGAQEVMNFLGRKLHGKFEGEIVSDLSSWACWRTGGSRITHRVKENWLKIRFHQPRHSRTASIKAASAYLRPRPPKAKCTSEPYLSPLPRSRPDRQNPSNTTLACHRVWTSGDGDFAICMNTTFQTSMPQWLHNVLRQSKEVTTNESIRGKQ